MHRRLTPALLCAFAALAASPTAAAEPGRGEVEVGLLGQLQAEGGSDDAEPTLRLRRLRPMLRAERGGLEALAVVDVAKGDAEVIDAWVGGPLGALRWRAGQQKLPLTAFRQRSIARLGLVDWPLLSTWLGGERQLGVAVDAGGAEGGWSAQLGLFEGRNTRRAHGVAPALLFYGAPQSAAAGSIHPEAVARVGWRAGRAFGASLGAAADAAPVRGEDASWRGSAEVEGRLGRLHLEAVAQVADLPAPGRDAWGLRAWGGWASAAWEEDTWGLGASASGIALESPLRHAAAQRLDQPVEALRGHANLTAWWTPEGAPWSLRADLQTATRAVAPDLLGRLLLQATF